MKKKLPIIVLLTVVILVLISIAFIFKPFGSSNSSSQNSSSNADQNFVLSDYPADKVPLYDGIEISSMKYIVNENPTNAYDEFFGERRNYYNIVFSSDDSRDKVLDFYKSKMSTINEDSIDDSTIEGVIDVYRVSIANYGEDDFYLEVHLPSDDYSKTNPYYGDYKEFVEIANNWVEFENSYGLLNQLGGQIEYTQWFDVDTSMYDKDSAMRTNPIGEYYKIYKEKYSQKTDFSADDENGRLTWTEDDFEITASFTVDHGRIYLMFRKPM